MKRAVLSLLPRGLLLRRGPPEGKVFLTFDDGPHPENTEKILDVLKTAGAKATFFMNGKEVEKYPSIAKKVVAEGHEAASHGWSHHWDSHLDFRRMREEISRTLEVLRLVCGVSTNSHRPPYGRLTAPLLIDAYLGKINLVLWSLDSDDDRTKSPSSILQKCARASEGDIILFHDDNTAITQALPELIREMRGRGLKFGSVGEITAGHG